MDPGSIARVMTSLPRSGTHWVKSLISHLLDAPALDERILDTGKLQTALLNDAPKKLIYDHFEYDSHCSVLNEVLFPNLRMIVLFRHPLDALVSMYYKSAAEKTLHDNSQGPMENLRLFLSIHKTGAPIPDCFKKHPKYKRLIRRDYLRYYIRNYVVDWLLKNNCLPVRFEDLLNDTRAGLKRIASFLKIEYSEGKIEESIRLYDFKSLSGGRRPGEIDLESHYRRGIVGEWRDVFGKADLEIVRDQIGDYLSYLNYSID